MPTRRLELIFTNVAGRRVVIRVPDPRTDLTPEEIRAAMESILAGNVFESAGGDLIGIVGARIVSTDQVEYDFSS